MGSSPSRSRRFNKSYGHIREPFIFVIHSLRWDLGQRFVYFIERQLPWRVGGEKIKSKIKNAETHKNAVFYTSKSNFGLCHRHIRNK
ncbi:unnamed protein product [Rhizophagus irregularis]|nr:unnamed protein product [Rhizophagus irregularis]